MSHNGEIAMAFQEVRKTSSQEATPGAATAADLDHVRDMAEAFLVDESAAIIRFAAGIAEDSTALLSSRLMRDALVNRLREISPRMPLMVSPSGYTVAE
jgi:hypothetical protein